MAIEYSVTERATGKVVSLNELDEALCLISGQEVSDTKYSHLFQDFTGMAIFLFDRESDERTQTANPQDIIEEMKTWDIGDESINNMNRVNELYLLQYWRA